MAPAAPNASAASDTQGQGPLRVHYDRVAIALLGCFSVLAFVIGGALALAGLFSGWVPMAGLLLSLASFASLRALAVRARRAKLLARMEATRKLAMEPKTESVQQPAKKPQGVFDAQPDSNKRPPVLTVQELRAEALRIAASGAAVQRPAGWEPTEVPLPQYVVANTARRPAPEALEVEEPKKPSTGTSLRAQEADQRLAEAATTAQAAETTRTAANPADENPADGNPADQQTVAVLDAAAAKARLERAKREGDRINLDDVMQRRRA